MLGFRDLGFEVLGFNTSGLGLGFRFVVEGIVYIIEVIVSIGTPKGIYWEHEALGTPKGSIASIGAMGPYKGLCRAGVGKCSYTSPTQNPN